MTQLFENICNAMADPGFYPHDVSSVERVDTHISAVFLTGEWVYKIKKPVRFDFLDFTKPEDRRYYCEQEIILNQRLSRDIYREVVIIYQDEAGRVSFELGGEEAEYAVKMRQLPDTANLKHILTSGGTVHPEKIRRVAENLSEFYKNAVQSSDIDTYGDLDNLSYNLEETISEIDPFADEFPDREQWEFICQVSRNFLKNREALFKHRIRTGRIRDGHGDLKPDHVYFYKGIQIIDCIEFNNRFRYGDSALDLSFLHMELDHLGHADLGRELLKTYAVHADDREFYALIDYYCAYRALVRVKICSISLEGADDERKNFLRKEIRLYFKQAFRHCILFGRPTLWVFFGPPASGKSTLAELTGESIFLPVFRSDVVRKQEMPVSDEAGGESFNEGIYRESMRDHIYTHLLALAQDNLKKGASAILDATFSKTRWRDAVRRLAADTDANLIFVHCTASNEALLNRLNQRETGSDGESDARAAHFDDLMANFEPVVETDQDTLISVDTEASVKHTLYEILTQGYALKNAQIVRRIAGGMS